MSSRKIVSCLIAITMLCLMADWGMTQEVDEPIKKLFQKKLSSIPSNDSTAVSLESPAEVTAEVGIVIYKVDLELNNASPTVGGNIHPMDESEEELMGAEIRINADFDENNKNSVGMPVEDFRSDATAGHRIVANDPDLLDGTLKMLGSAIKGRWRIFFLPQIKVWKQVGGAWIEVVSNSLSEEVALPLNLPLKVEGIEGSYSTDVLIRAQFIPNGATTLCGDQAKLTVVKTEFMLTFDDGPRPFTTDQVLTALEKFYVNGERVKAAFFQVGLDGSGRAFWDIARFGPQGSVHEYPAVTRKIVNAGHIVGNHTQHHKWFWPSPSEQEVKDEILACEAEIRAALGKDPPKLFRSPYVIDSDPVKSGAKELGYNLIWGGLFEDVKENVFDNVEHVVDLASKDLEEWNKKERPNRTEPRILIFHDILDLIGNNLELIVKHLQDKGFVLVHFDTSRLVSQITKP